MPSRRLGILAIASLVMLVVLLYGYFAAVGPMVQRTTFSGTMLNSKGFYLRLNHGCFEFISFQWDGEKVYFPTLRPGTLVRFEFQNERATMHESLWGFQVTTAGQVARSVRFPIWCLLLPCTIAPLLWLGRRSKHLGRGFAMAEEGIRGDSDIRASGI